MMTQKGHAMCPSQSFVLVVDDNAYLRILLSYLLEEQGYAVTMAENGRQALARLRAQHFDLLLLDITMPEMNGYQVLESLKTDPTLRHLPVIVISAVDELDSVVRCIELGAEDYLLKPFSAVLLKARMGACLEKKRLRDNEQAYVLAIQTEQERSERLRHKYLFEERGIIDVKGMGEMRTYFLIARAVPTRLG
jgi:adenylate cyclase